MGLVILILRKLRKYVNSETNTFATRQASNEGCEDLRRQGQDLINLHNKKICGFMFWEKIIY